MRCSTNWGYHNDHRGTITLSLTTLGPYKGYKTFIWDFGELEGGPHFFLLLLILLSYIHFTFSYLLSCFMFELARSCSRLFCVAHRLVKKSSSDRVAEFHAGKMYTAVCRLV